MNAQPSLHPTDRTLSAYGLGQLDDAAAGLVHTHLEGCPDCRRRVAEVTSDSFLGRLRDARGRTNSLRPSVSATEGLPLLDAGAAVAMPPPADTLPPGLADHPDYQIIRELGRGGMGVVYLAQNTLMGRMEVLKVVGAHLVSRPAVLERFLREIRSAARLQHPNIVAAYSALRLGESLVFTMEYVDGLDLARLVKAAGPLPVSKACSYVHQAALGLQHAHEHGMVHRDIKPANLILARAGAKGDKAIVKVLDFGLAKVTSEGQRDSGLTREGQMLGTPDYIAPEQIRDAQSADIRADIYSLGCTLYYLLSGGPPFGGTNLWDIYQAHFSMDAGPLNLSRPEVPVELAALVAKMMAKEPGRRFQEPKEVAQALKPFFKAGLASSMGSRPDVSQATYPDEPPRRVVEAAGRTEPATGKSAATARPGKAASSTEPESIFKDLIDLREAEPLHDTMLDTLHPATGPALRRGGEPSRSGVLAALDGLGAKGRWAAAGVLLLGMIIACAALVLRVKTRDGVVVLENLPEQAEVYVDGNKITVTWPDGGVPAEITVPAGEHGVQVKMDGMTTFGEEVRVDAGGRRGLRVKLERSEAGGAAGGESRVANRPTEPSSTATNPAAGTPVTAGSTRAPRPRDEVTENWVSLFNGQDLKGWTRDSGPPDAWRVENGELVVTGPGDYRKSGFLLTDREYSDFLLKLEFQPSLDANSGVVFWARPGVLFDGIPHQPQIEIFGADKPMIKNGSFIWSRSIGVREILPPFRPLDLRPAGRWNQMQVEVRGGLLRLEFNGREVFRSDLSKLAQLPGAHPSLLRRSGRIGLQSHSGWVRFRKIEIKSVRPPMSGSASEADESGPTSPPAVLANDFVRVFNGKDLTGWAGALAEFEVQDGTIRCKRGRHGTIYYNKEFSDFVARVEFRLSPGANDGLAIRYPGSGEPALTGMCEIQVLDDFAPQYARIDPRQYHGSAYGMVAASRGHLRPPGEWNFQEVTVKGRHVKVELNGAVILDADLGKVTRYMNKGVPPSPPRDSGFFGFAGHGEPVDYRKIEIKALSSAPAIGSSNAATSGEQRTSGKSTAKSLGDRPAVRRAPADAKEFQGKFYKLFPQQFSWHEAKRRCEEAGGHLAVVTNEEQNRFLTRLVLENRLAEAWLGATDEQVEGRWVWVDGRRMSYSKWGPGQPNNKQGLEHFAVLVASRDGEWSDQPDNSVQHSPVVICQWD